MRTTTLLAIFLVARAAALAGFSDEGVFLLYFDQERAGRLTFQWKPDGTFTSTSVLAMGGDSTRFTVKVTPDSGGRWLTASYESALGKTVVERKGGELTIAFPNGSGRGTAPEGLLVFDDLSPALISQALLLYDAGQGGRQEFPVLRLSAMGGGPFTLECLETVEREIAGSRLRLTHWRYEFTGAELHVLAGPDSRIYLVTGVPWFATGGFSEQHTFLVREGYEGLLPAEPDDPLISQPKFQIRESTIKIPMRDGVRLATDLYLPAGVPRAPVILVRTPYKKEVNDMRARYYAHRGYAVAIQDVRGRFASEGEWEALVHEPKDGYDTIEWLAAQPWSTGKVGMVGASYLGWVQWFAASQHPRHLVTIIPNVSPPDPFHNLPYEHGLVALMAAMPWFAVIESESSADLSGVKHAAVDGKRYLELLKVLPVIDVDKAVLGRESPSWRHWLTHSTVDEYWKPLMFLDKMKEIRIPVFHQSAWFDGDGIGSKLNYLAMAGNPRATQKLTIGPWAHVDTAMRSSNGSDFGAAAVIDLQREYLRWFDYWLKGIDNGILREPPVNLYVMGSNRWLQGSRYPLPETRFEKLYLTAGGGLSFTAPSREQPPDRYVYDPGDPTPSTRNLRTTARR
ncbi:MAG: hypothetical protein JWP63_5006, partial [Candidatus Solibacter sp.]|nr:hypothetical protein [Candidatus Solibacter sp.]